MSLLNLFNAYKVNNNLLAWVTHYWSSLLFKFARHSSISYHLLLLIVKAEIINLSKEDHVGAGIIIDA